MQNKTMAWKVNKNKNNVPIKHWLGEEKKDKWGATKLVNSLFFKGSW
jgi:hypothetical protein